MAKEAATKGHKIKGNPSTSHTWTVGNTTSTTSCSFEATINDAVSDNVFINGREAATADSVADAGSVPETVAGSTQVVPEAKAKGTISKGSSTVTINEKGAARNADPAEACRPGGKVVVDGNANVFIGD